MHCKRYHKADKVLTILTQARKVGPNPQSAYNEVHHMVSQNFVPAQVTKDAGKITSELLQMLLLLEETTALTWTLPKNKLLAVIPDHHQRPLSLSEI